MKIPFFRDKRYRAYLSPLVVFLQQGRISAGAGQFKIMQHRDRVCRCHWRESSCGKTFTDKIKIEGEDSHTIVKHTIRNNRLCFEADLPDQNDMIWSKDRREATGISKMTIRFGKQKASLKCMLKYIANRPPATAGGSISIEEVEYKAMTYKRSGGSVTFRIPFKRDGKL